MQTVLVTGATGYIGSHTIVELCKCGYAVVAIDNLCNSRLAVVDRIKKIVTCDFPFYELDIRNEMGLDAVVKQHKIDAVIHLAALKSIEDSIAYPHEYYDNNVCGTITLMKVLKKAGVKNIVFSSTASIYGSSEQMPVNEGCSLNVTHPYGYSKLVGEKFLADIARADSQCRIAILRYFNPVGAHESGLIGEDPKGIPANLMPYISQVSAKKLKRLNIFGRDWPTSDGTPIRDYIHIMDLANGHVSVLDYLRQRDDFPLVVNLGTGVGYSVLDVVKTFEQETGCQIPYEFKERRDGDIAICYADVSLAQRELGWKAKRNLADMCRDAWNWQAKNPDGFI